MNIKKFKDFKSINENKVADAIHQAIENHMNGDMESLETIAGLTGLDTESIVSVLNQYLSKLGTLKAILKSSKSLIYQFHIDNCIGSHCEIVFHDSVVELSSS